MKFLYRNLFYVLLTAICFISCNDDSSLDANDKNKEVLDCSQDVKKECMLGRWKIDTVIINDLEQNTTISQKQQYIEYSKDDKIDAKLYLVRNDRALLDEKNPVIISNLNYSLLDDGENKKVRFQQNQIKVEFIVQSIQNNKMTLLTKGKVESTNKDYKLITIWNKV